MQIIDSTQQQLALPGTCVICGAATGTRRFFVDTQHDIDFFGVIYICLEECFKTIANAAGFLVPDKARELVARIEEQNKSLHILVQENKRLEVLVDAFSKSIDTRNLDLNQLNFNDTGWVEPSKELASALSEDGPEVLRGKTELSEPPDDEGVAELPLRREPEPEPVDFHF